ncbi:MAG TPA: hypothetical protein VFV52_06530 [Bacilli bacterium]|nr:hypothetical protein [Bacilli bacterium]
MTETWIVAMLLSAGLGACFGYLIWGTHKWVRQGSKQRIRRRERVLFSSDVNTKLLGYEYRRNHFGLLIWALVWLWFIWLNPQEWSVIGAFPYLMYAVRRLTLLQAERLTQTYLLTERGAHLLPAQGVRPIWKRLQAEHVRWHVIDGYRIDGGYLQFYRGDRLLLQAEYGLHDYEQVRHVLHDLGVKRLELTDRIWVAQLDEPAFFLLEDEVCDKGWEVLELFHSEWEHLKVRPEFGVMRNVPGDRLLDEHSRSWLQLNLIDVETEEPLHQSAFPLWNSYGNVGYLNGLVKQELVDHLQRWTRNVVEEAVREREGVVS